MRVLFVDGYKEVLHRGASRAVAGLSSFLRGEGWEIEKRTTRTIGDPVRTPDLLVWSGPTYNQGIIDTIGARRSILWKHGDESLHAYPIEAIATGKAHLCVPSLWAGKKLGWNLPFHVLYPAFEPPPRTLPPVGTRWLYMGAFEPGKGTHEALEWVRRHPDERFVFRSSSPDKGRRLILPNADWESYTDSQEELWHDVKGVLLTSLYETFSILAYEAMSRGLLVVAPLTSGGSWGNSVDMVVNEWAYGMVSSRMCDPVDREGLHITMKRVHHHAAKALFRILED